tara:strand:+ start:561 stop:686 length:126 start_codon:yes stop_codon:yes gene_type:complete
MINNKEDTPIVNTTTKDEVIYSDSTTDAIEKLNLPHPDYEG